MSSRRQVKQLLKEAGHPELFTEENYQLATTLTKFAERKSPMLKQHFENGEGLREMYKCEVILKNKLKK